MVSHKSVTPRTPSRVPFVTLFLVAIALQPVIQRAVLYSNSYWAGGLILGSLLLASASMLIGGGPGYSTTLSAVLWIIPALILTYHSNPVAILCLIPMFVGLSPFLPRSEAPKERGLIASFLMQGALILHICAPAVLALAPAALSIALILWAKETPAKPGRFKLASGLIAAALTVFLLSPAVPLMPGGSVRATTLVPPPAESEPGTSTNAHLGIVLRPKAETKDHELPPPPKIQPETERVIPKVPMEIPFSGVYWMFQTPLNAPPASAPVLEESPIDGQFSSDGWTPIHLEAHQTFNQPFPLRRIESIGVTISSQDKYPTTLSMDLFVSSSNTPQYNAFLGTLPLDTLSSTQMLRFKVPASPYVNEFDRLTLRFHLTMPRLHIAPRIGIEKFTLYPR